VMRLGRCGGAKTRVRGVTAMGVARSGGRKTDWMNLSVLL